MRLLSLLVTTGFLLLSAVAGHNTLKPKGPPCPKGDGLYAVGCSEKYLECVNNVEFERPCPAGLYFDRLLGRCDSKATNFLCNQVKDSSKINIPIRQKAITIDCKGRADGDYAFDEGICSPLFYQCANDRSFTRTCPYNQVFSVYLRRCDYENECHKANYVKRRPASAYASPTHDADKFEVTAFEVVDGSGPKVNCTQQGDSFMSHLGCSPYFWQCSNGKLFRKTCPSGLIYVLNQNLCDYPQGVKGCPEFDGSEPSYQQKEPLPHKTPLTTTQSYEHEQTTKPTPVYNLPYVQSTTKPAPIYVQPTTKPTPVYVQPTTKPTPVYVQPTTKPTPVYVQSSAKPEEVYTRPAYVSPTPTTPPVYAAAPAAPVVHDAEEVAILAKCSGKADGFYEISSCHKNFLTCTNGIGRIIGCVQPLVYDPRINSCEYLDKCKAPRKLEAVPSLHNHGGVHDKKPEEKKVDFDCSDKADGNYFKEACVKEYYQCHDRRAFLRNCPADLVYNKAAKACDFATNCEKHYMEPTRLYGNEVDDSREEEDEEEEEEEYTTVASTAAPYNKPAPVYTQPATTVGYQQPTKAQATSTVASYTSTTPSVARDNFSCSGRQEGNHASGMCKRVYYTCVHNQLSATRCPASLKYNSYIDQCDYEENNPDCPGHIQPQILPMPSVIPYARPTTAAPTTTTTAPSTPGYNAPVETTQTPVYASVQSYQSTQMPKNNAQCELLADGVYGEPCKNWFIQCVNFETNVITCQSGLFYSHKQDRCDHPQNVEGCPEYVPTTIPAQDETTPAPYATKTYPNIDYTTPVPGPVDTTPIAEAFSCYGRADGIYALPYCSHDYVQCMAGRTFFTTCAGGLYYSEQTGLCDYKENVSICRLRKGADSIVDNACLGKADGYYSAGCSTHYFSCIGEKIRKMVCPTNLKFSEKSGICDYPKDVQECVIAVPSPSPPAVPSEFCVIRPNGLHRFGQCSSHYIVCENAIAIAGTCASPLVFNEDSQLCDYKRNNKDCGSDYVPSADVKGYFASVEKTTASSSILYVPTTTTKKYQPTTRMTTTTTTAPASDAPETTMAYTTTTTQAYVQPTTTTTAAPYTQVYSTTTTMTPTTTKAYTTTTTMAPTTTTKATTEAYTTTTTPAPTSDEITVPATTTSAYTQKPADTTTSY